MFSRDFPGTVEAAAEAEAWIAGQSGALGLAQETAFAISLCVEELFLNAVKHGRANTATLSIWTEPDGARLEFVDDGRAFDLGVASIKRLDGPGTGFEVGGFGLGLVHKFARRITYRRAEGANRVVLEFDDGPSESSGPGAVPGS